MGGVLDKHSYESDRKLKLLLEKIFLNGKTSLSDEEYKSRYTGYGLSRGIFK